MNHRQKPSQSRIKNPAYCQAFERLDEALEENTRTDNRETIRMLRMAMFGDLDKLEESGAVVHPK